MRLCGEQPRRARALSGAVHYERFVYECPRCRASAAPLDGELGLSPGEALTRAVVRKAAWSAAMGSFAWASRNMKEMAGLEVSPAECQRSALDAGRKLDERQREDEARRLAPAAPDAPGMEPEIDSEQLVLMADATSVLTVAGEEHKSVYCGRAFALEDREAKQSPDQAGRRFIGLSRHTASATDLEDFAPRMKALAWRMGMRSARRTAFVADGAAALWKWAEENLPSDTVLIQDFWHVAEHLAALCRDVFGEPGEGERLKRWKEALAQSRVGEILEELKRESKRRRGANQQRLKKEIGYLEHGRHRMDYARYRAEGWPIGSGAIEADCKHLVKERFNLTGARWRRANIHGVLALRLGIFNDEWEAAWSRN
jgi:hypothetical protein